MKLNEFQEHVDERWPPKAGWIYPVLGLAGEVGEVVEEFKKSMRPGSSLAARTPGIILELGDVLHYLARVASEMNLTLEEIAVANLEKTANHKGTHSGA